MSMKDQKTLDKKAKEEILKQRYLFRGTNDIAFNDKRNTSFYFGRKEWRDGRIQLVTSLTPDALYAMISGLGRLNSDWMHYPKGAKPVLLAINTEKYIRKLEKGVEPSEFEIIGKIDYSDIVLLDSQEILLEFYLKANKKCKRHEMEFFLKKYL